MTITQFLEAAAPYAISVLAALASYIVGRIKSRSVEKQVKTIEDYLDTTQGKLMWIVCPNCGTKLYLCNLAIRTDEEDNNNDDKQQ